MNDWTGELYTYHSSTKFGGSLEVIEIGEDDVNSELLSKCVDHFVVSEVTKGYFIAPKNIEDHLTAINEHGLEPYLEERLRRVQNE
jgi:hypothetical protein